MRSTVNYALLLSAALSRAPRVYAGYTLKDQWIGEQFLQGGWIFETEDDPTHGTVDYVDRDTAVADNLAYGV